MSNAIALVVVMTCAAGLGLMAYAVARWRRDAFEILACLDHAVVVLDKRRRIETFNAAFLSWFGGPVRRGDDFASVLSRKHDGNGIDAEDLQLVNGLAPAHGQVRVVIDGHPVGVRCIVLRDKRMAYVMEDRSAVERLSHAIRRVEAERTALLDIVPVGLTIAASGSGEVRYANQRAATYLGFDNAQELIGRSGLELCHSDTQRDYLQQRLRENGIVEGAELELRTRDGMPLWALVSARAIELDHERLIFASVSNITHNKRTEHDLRDSAQKLRHLLDAAPCAIFMIDLQDGRLVFFNRHADDLFGLQDGDTPRAEADFMPPDDLALLMNTLRRVGTVADREMQCQTSLGEVHWFHVSAARVEHDGRSAMFCALLDIDARRQAEVEVRVARAEAEDANRELRLLNMELEQLANTDRLTNAFNRRHFEEVALREMSRARRYNLPLALIIIDLDHFKLINDDFGHAAGDRVLVEFTQLARKHLRSSDVLARWGGEEFVVLATSTALDEALVLADKLRELLELHPFDGLRTVTLSAGVTSLSLRDTFDAFVRRADKALYAAKSEGRNRVVAIGQELAA
ncbi:MAG: diguanylate cyclase [Rhodocyclaceae bacterium]